MAHRHPFRERRTVVSAGGATDDVVFGPIDKNRYYFIARLAVEDETSAPSTDIRVFVDGHGYTHWLLEQNSPATGTLYWHKVETFLVMGESLVARFTGATLDDILQLYFEGWWIELGPEGDM